MPVCFIANMEQHRIVSDSGKYTKIHGYRMFVSAWSVNVKVYYVSCVFMIAQLLLLKLAPWAQDLPGGFLVTESNVITGT